MKLKSAIFGISALLGVMTSSSAATFIISNLDLGPGDALYASKANEKLTGTIVSLGYFNSSTIAPTTIPQLFANLSNFVSVTSILTGVAPDAGVGVEAGYAQQQNLTSIGTITGLNALLGRTVYAIATNTANLAIATLDSEYALVSYGQILDDNPNEITYTANPKGLTPVIGTVGSLATTTGMGAGTYATLNLAAVPEPSAALLGALGALGLLRRRRN
jgi:NAD/NADP transhydrogenase beta subunit